MAGNVPKPAGRGSKAGGPSGSHHGTGLRVSLLLGTPCSQQRHIASHLFSTCTYLNPEPRFFEIRQPRSGGFWPETKDKDVLKGSRVCKLKTQLVVNVQGVPKEQGELRGLWVRKEHTRGESVLHSLLMGWSEIVIFQGSSGLDNATFSPELFRWLSVEIMFI